MISPGTKETGKITIGQTTTVTGQNTISQIDIIKTSLVKTASSTTGKGNQMTMIKDISNRSHMIHILAKVIE